MFLNNLDYRIIRYRDETYGMHEVYTEDGKVKGIFPEPIIEADSPEDIVCKLRDLLRIAAQNINNSLDADSFQSDISDFME